MLRNLLGVMAVCVMLPGCMSMKADRDVTMSQQLDKGEPRFSLWSTRRVAWLERGDPQGYPVFYAHGNPGSRLELLFMDAKAWEYGVRLIVMDRPGIGGSDFVSNYGLLDFARDIEKLADEKGIEGFGLMGWSSGGPPVLAAAYYLPQRVRFAISISGYTNFGEYAEARALMSEYGLRGPELSEEHPVLFRQALKVARWADLALPEVYMAVAEGEMPPSDQALLQDKARSELFVRNQQEALAQGVKGTIQDLKVQWKAWPFELAEIHVPVHIYQGERDTFVPVEFARHMAREIPDVSLDIMPESGHLLPLDPMFLDHLFRRVQRYIAGNPVSKPS
ncbi:alpha/beta fold hydrolase [Marinobacter sp. 2_MG-2023]|uniref:alpha/beta fold hydrolase n=1 Tax=Marinobacter sp. 2_MG-2023 TaxID=3062679 RepID=UPI0026E18F05|nr:alpha/beta hydrolase [Marinobacter sp. 2_MG-2023]MDO6441181.1 alpha/beta hydrolase [Marinobacter sp. 2_MG-2023]